MNGIYESERDRRKAIEIFATRGCTPHFHAQIEILCVRAGYVTVTVNGETVRMGAGDVCVSGSYDMHAYIAEEGSEGIVILLPLPYLQRFFAYGKNRVFARHFAVNAASYDSIVGLLDLYRAAGGQENVLFEEGWTNALLGLLCNEFPLTEKSGESRVDTMREVLNYIDSHASEALTLQSISKRFGYSPYHFSRMFNTFAGIGLKKYINIVRLEAAAAELKNGADVTSAALDAGFTAMRTFYREFAEYYGETPQRYVRGKLAGCEKSRDK